MKIGLQITRFNWPGVAPVQIADTFKRIVQSADGLGFDSLWVMDHFFQMELPQRNYSAEQPMLDGYTLLAFAAACTQKMTLGTMVTGVHYRQPGHLLKIISNLDVLSGGRAVLGIGAGWYERESKGLGFPFPPVSERFERLEETLLLAGQLNSADTRPFAGKHYQLAEPMFNPAPLHHIPILIGGGGEHKTLRLCAQYADACNIFGYPGPDFVAQKLQVLRTHCDHLKRDYAAIEKTTLNTLLPSMSAADVISMARAQAAVGVQHMMWNMPHDHELQPLEMLARDVLPVMRTLA